MLSLFKKICIFIAILALAGCFSDRHTISKRKMGEPVNAVTGREIAVPTTPQDVYTKQKVIAIKPIKKSNTNGSLTSAEDPRSYLLASTAPVMVGSFLNIKTVTSAEAAKAAAAGGAAKPAAQTAAQVEQDLLKSLPNLDPAPGEPEKPTVIPGFKAEVLEILDNGDAIISYHRRSIRGDQAGDYLVKARVPQADLLEKDSLSTSNLVDVDFQESKDGELSERHSSRWEDEYTLRMSGFDEAKSKSAVALEDQRRQIKDTRDKLATQIKAFSTERQTVAKERSVLFEKQKETAEKKAELEAKIKDQESELEKFKAKEEEAKLAEEQKAADEEASKDPKAPKTASTGNKTAKQPTTAAKPTPAKPVAQAKPAATTEAKK